MGKAVRNPSGAANRKQHRKHALQFVMVPLMQDVRSRNLTTNPAQQDRGIGSTRLARKPSFMPCRTEVIARLRGIIAPHCGIDHKAGEVGPVEKLVRLLLPKGQYGKQNNHGVFHNRQVYPSGYASQA